NMVSYIKISRKSEYLRMQMCACEQAFKTLKVHVNAKQKILLLTYAKFAYVQVYLRMQIGACVRGLTSKTSNGN
ncbi:MAG: hypothetical protein N0E48_28555, partial [Candidatus Thiodiazotropha endolucinida]|nr:hypothetical protein [Candidatus Thiodiazotropha taylori]MCW4347270.1 hypothetical protein [Candidatus Thiodiazotropha endolucinida]